jgi:hypothetical protein
MKNLFYCLITPPAGDLLLRWTRMSGMRTDGVSQRRSDSLYLEELDSTAYLASRLPPGTGRLLINGTIRTSS